MSETSDASSGPVMPHGIGRLIGNTPLVRLCGMGREDGAPIFVKLEQTNPSGSIRDRYIAEILNRSVDAGQMLSGDRVALAGLDDSAVSAACIGAILGLDVHIFIPEGASRRLLDMLVRYGATPHWCDGGLDGAIEQAAAWSRDGCDRFYVDGFRRQAVQDAYGAMAQEIRAALGARTLGAFVTSVSTGGTFREVTPHLREHYPTLRVGGAVLIDADVADLLTNLRDTLQRISLEDAWSMRDRVARETGLLLSPKGAACVELALQMQASVPAEHAIVALNPDAGQRYLGWEAQPIFTHVYPAYAPSRVPA